MSFKIYTKTGDAGKTGLVGGERVSKNHPRLLAYGEVDELNAHIGTILADFPTEEALQKSKKQLTLIQHRLFNLGSTLACPEGKTDQIPTFKSEWVTDLELWIDDHSADLPPLTSFILPAGTPLSTKAHVARTVCRRAERSAVELIDIESLKTPLQFLNRLSDYLFIISRYFNSTAEQPDITWQK